MTEEYEELVVPKINNFDDRNNELHLIKTVKQQIPSPYGNVILLCEINYQKQNEAYVPDEITKIVLGCLEKENENGYVVKPIGDCEINGYRTVISGKGSGETIYFLDPTAKDIGKIPIEKLQLFDMSGLNLIESNVERDVNLIGGKKNILTTLDLYFVPAEIGNDVYINGGILGHVIAKGLDDKGRVKYLIEPLKGKEKKKATDEFMREIVEPTYERLKERDDISSIVPDINDFEPFFW